jgi:hypothetical protein
MMLLSTLLLASNVSAGGYSEETVDGVEQRVEVSLHGITRFGAVQLFDYLLGKMPKIVALQQTRSLIATDEPDRCRVDWTAQIINGDGAEILEELHGIMNNLDPETQNDILYDAPFVVMREDLELLKRVIPVESGVGYAVFAVEGQVAEDRIFAIPRKNAQIPWYLAEGAGFE